MFLFLRIGRRRVVPLAARLRVLVQLLASLAAWTAFTGVCVALDRPAMTAIVAAPQTAPQLSTTRPRTADHLGRRVHDRRRARGGGGSAWGNTVAGVLTASRRAPSPSRTLAPRRPSTRRGGGAGRSSSRDRRGVGGDQHTCSLSSRVALHALFTATLTRCAALPRPPPPPRPSPPSPRPPRPPDPPSPPPDSSSNRPSATTSRTDLLPSPSTRLSAAWSSTRRRPCELSASPRAPLRLLGALQQVDRPTRESSPPVQRARRLRTQPPRPRDRSARMLAAANSARALLIFFDDVTALESERQAVGGARARPAGLRGLDEKSTASSS